MATFKSLRPQVSKMVSYESAQRKKILINDSHLPEPETPTATKPNPISLNTKLIDLVSKNDDLPLQMGTADTKATKKDSRNIQDISPINRDGTPVNADTSPGGSISQIEDQEASKRSQRGTMKKSIKVTPDILALQGLSALQQFQVPTEDDKNTPKTNKASRELKRGQSFQLPAEDGKTPRDNSKRKEFKRGGSAAIQNFQIPGEDTPQRKDPTWLQNFQVPEEEFRADTARSKEGGFFETEGQEALTSRSKSKGLPPKYIHKYAHVRAISSSYGSAYIPQKSARQTSRSRDGRTDRSKKATDTDTIQTRSQSPPSKASFYYSILTEIQHMQLNENIDEADEMIVKADKHDQQAYAIMEAKIGRRFANALFFIMKQYSEDSGTNSNKLSFLKLLKLLKDFEILDMYCSKEEVLMFYSRRCRKNLTDFSAFIDILYKISKLPNNGVVAVERNDRYTSFQKFIDEVLISKVSRVLKRTPYKPTFTKIGIFAGDEASDHEVLALFEQHDALLRHLFMLYEIIDLQYSQNSFISLKSFKKFGQDFSLIPCIISLKEGTEIFRRLQMGGKPIIDYKGFIKLVALLAHIGFSKPSWEGKLDSYAKKLSKIMTFLEEANSRLSDELVYSKLTEAKEPKHVIA